MEIPTLENGKMMNLMDKVYISFVMDSIFKENSAKGPVCMESITI
jgi:hypothetical protein